MLYRVLVADIVLTNHPQQSGYGVTQAECPVPTQNVFRLQTGQTIPAAATKNRNMQVRKRNRDKGHSRASHIVYNFFPFLDLPR